MLRPLYTLLCVCYNQPCSKTISAKACAIDGTNLLNRSRKRLILKLILSPDLKARGNGGGEEIASSVYAQLTHPLAVTTPTPPAFTGSNYSLAKPTAVPLYLSLLMHSFRRTNTICNSMSTLQKHCGRNV